MNSLNLSKKFMEVVEKANNKQNPKNIIIDNLGGYEKCLN